VATPLTFNKRGNGQQLPPDNARDDDEREQPMTFTVSQVNAWRAELAAMPAPDPTTRAVGKRAALEMMAKELQALCRRGYTTAELLELLATKGLHTHEETLRAVLRTARPSGLGSPGDDAAATVTVANRLPLERSRPGWAAGGQEG
jgi:hypothetical protein